MSYFFHDVDRFTLQVILVCFCLTPQGTLCGDVLGVILQVTRSFRGDDANPSLTLNFDAFSAYLRLYLEDKVCRDQKC